MPDRGGEEDKEVIHWDRLGRCGGLGESQTTISRETSQLTKGEIKKNINSGASKRRPIKCR